jgi:hypothetical protein
MNKERISSKVEKSKSSLLSWCTVLAQWWRRERAHCLVGVLAQWWRRERAHFLVGVLSQWRRRERSHCLVGVRHVTGMVRIT